MWLVSHRSSTKSLFRKKKGFRIFSKFRLEKDGLVLIYFFFIVKKPRFLGSSLVVGAGIVWALEAAAAAAAALSAATVQA